MGHNHWVSYFFGLAVLATALLWGISLVNGTVKALLLAVWYRDLGNGIPFHVNYTGIPFIDYPIALLVAFFYYGTSGYDEAYQLFLLDAYSALQPAFVWLYIETMRPREKLGTLGRPVVFGTIWQCFGAAISLPIYFANHLAWLQSAGHNENRVLSLNEAKALPFSFLLGATLPTVVGMAPTWLGYGQRDAKSHQSILAAWQPDPLWVSIIQIWGAAGFAQIMTRRNSNVPGRSSQAKQAHKWTLISYLVALVSSASGHLYVVYRVVTSQNEGTSLWRMYIPQTFVQLEGIEHILLEGPWLFLKFDFFIISLSSLSWAYYLLRHTLMAEHKLEASAGLLLPLVMLCGSVLVGPGTLVSLALLWRERRLVESKEEKAG